MENKIRILFATPYFGKSGSEMVILNLIKNIYRIYDIAVYCPMKGILFDRLPSDVKKFCLVDYKNKDSLFKKIIQYIFKIKTRPRDEVFLEQLIKEFNPDVWYINTIILPEVLSFSKKNKHKIILHTHEMDHIFYYLDKQHLKNIIDYPDFIITVSETIYKSYVTLGRKSKMQVIYPSIDYSEIILTDQDIRGKHNIPRNAFVWGMSGYFDANKNPLLFIEVAKSMIDKDSNNYFLWIGGNIDSGISYYIKKKIEEFGIMDNIIFTGFLEKDYYDYINTIDCLFLTSTQDSFPLIMIEAGYFGKPIIGFNSGGISEFINSEKIGIVSQSWNKEDIIVIMEKIINKIVNFDSDLIKRRASEFDKVSFVSRITNVINSISK